MDTGNHGVVYSPSLQSPASSSILSPISAPSPSSSTTSSDHHTLPLICEECEDNSATLECDECGLVYCLQCDKYRHRKGKLVFHQRKRLVSISLDHVPSSFPEDTTQWTCAHVSEWLSEHELEVFLPEVNAHQINGAFLLSADMESFVETQSSASRGHKKKLLREVQKLKCQDVALPPPQPVPAPTIVTPPVPLERNALRRMGVNLRVNVDATPAPAPEKHFSPVTALRTRITHGQTDDIRGRVQRSSSVGYNSRRPTLNVNTTGDNAVTPLHDANTSQARRAPSVERDGLPPSLRIEVTPSISNLHINHETEPRVLRSVRQALGGLDLDMMQVSHQHAMEASFDFTAEGRLQTQGFEINTDGITNTPYNPRTTRPTVMTTETSCSSLGTREFLLILRELGHGASGKVYKALYMPTFQFVAIKVIRVYDQKKRHQMVRELKSLYVNYVPILTTMETTPIKAACDELVIFYDAFTNPELGSVSIVLEYMDGGSLEEYMQSKEQSYRSEEELARVAYCALKGLAFLHEHHQLHRDIKLSNMLMNSAGQVKISDFGISRDLESTLAKATTFTGTLLYMAPERISGGTYSYPSDIWSFGLALMACAVGKLPVPTKEGYWGVVHAVQEQPSPSLAEYGDHFSPSLCDFIDQCLQKNPILRPTASQLLEHDFIREHYTPHAFKKQPTSEVDALKELDQISKLIQTWCLDHVALIQSPINSTSNKTLFHQYSYEQKVEALASQLGIRENIVAERLAFMKQY